MNNHYDIGIVIVTWNGRQHLERLLPSLVLQDTDKKYKIVIVDNASSDGTREYLSHYSEIDLIFLSTNQGFAEPNNIGIRHVFEKYSSVKKIVFLNNDTIVPKSFLSALESGFSLAENVGSVQTKIVSLENQKKIDSVGILIDRSMSAINKGQGEIDIGQYDTSREIFGTTGSAMMVSSLALETIDLGNGNYFDPLYFAYQEDVDLAWRLRLVGYTAWYVSGDPVRHVHSATGKNYSAFKSFHIQRNTLLTLIKVLPLPVLFRSLVIFISRYFLHIQSVRSGQGSAAELSKKMSLCGMIWLVVCVWMSMIWRFPHLLIHRWKVRRKSVVSTSELNRWFLSFSANVQKMIYEIRS